MKAIVFADSHGSTEEMALVLRRHQPDVCLHLGNDAADIWEIRGAFPKTRFEAVRGNGDRGNAPEELLTMLGPVRVLMTHGHKYGVKQTRLRAEYAAKEKGAAILLFAHTHKPLLEYSGDLTIMNAGTVSGVYTGIFTYGIISINGDVKCSIENVLDIKNAEKGI